MREAWAVAVLAERAHTDCARSFGKGRVLARLGWEGETLYGVATTQASLTSSFYFPKSGWGSGGGVGEEKGG